MHMAFLGQFGGGKGVYDLFHLVQRILAAAERQDIRTVMLPGILCESRRITRRGPNAGAPGRPVWPETFCARRPTP